MARDFKPVNDRTINDVNAMNRDAWDSGEFKHTADISPSPSEKEYFKRQAETSGESAAAEALGTSKSVQFSKTKKSDPKRASSLATHAAHFGKMALGQDVRHTPEGGQRLVRNGQVVSHHDESVGEAHEKESNVQRAKMNLPPMKTGEEIDKTRQKLGLPREYKRSEDDARPEGTTAERIHAARTNATRGTTHTAASIKAARTKELIPADDPKHFANTGPRPGSVGGHPDTGDEVKKAVHLPRRAGRQWRKGEWS